jgi:hypothetical protein
MRGLLAPGRGDRSASGRSSSTSLRGRRSLPRPSLRRLRQPRGGGLVTPARAAGLLGMLASGFLLSFVTGPSAFALAQVDAPKLTWTGDAAIQQAVAVPQGANVFRVDTAPIEAALEALPGVATAAVRVTLPDAHLVVTIAERVPILAWQAGDTRYLADSDGVIFAAIPAETAAPKGVAIVDDQRVGIAGQLAIGGRLDPVDLDVATRLGSLSPSDVGSAAARLHVRITDTDGYSLYTDRGWTAVFGFYSPATRPAGMIPGQVRLLRSFLAGRESDVQLVTLASETSDTYVPKTTPKPAGK